MTLPADLCREAARLLQRRWKSELAPGETFTVSGSSGADGAEVVVRLDAPGGHDRVEVTVRVGVPDGAADQAEATDRALDAADAFLGEWLEGGRTERPPIDFVPYTFADRPALVRLVRSRPSLEAEADRLLAEAGGDPGDDGAGDD